MRRSKITAAAFAALVALASLGAACAQGIVVGGKNFTEQLLIAEMTSQLLRAKGYTVETRTGFSTSGIRKEQQAGLVDLYWEYTGTSLTTFNDVTEKLDPQQGYARVRELDATRGLAWLSPSKVNNTYALAMRKADAARRTVASISELSAKARAGERFTLASNAEFYFRPDGLRPLERAYGFEFGPQNVRRMETDAVYEVLRSSPDVDVGVVFSTDGRVARFGFVTLKDDLGFFPGYLLTPVVRADTLGRHPGLAEHLNALSAKLDDETISTLNASIDLDKVAVEAVASSFLKVAGLI